MRSFPVAALCGASLALTACSDPQLAITVRYDDPDLPARLRSLTLSVIELPPHPDGSPMTCDEVRYGRISRDQLDGGRRATASALSGTAGINGVPRLGDKLFVLEGRDRNGDRIAGGCEPTGDIDADLTLTVAAEVAPKVRVLGQRGVPRDPSAPPTDFDLGCISPGSTTAWSASATDWCRSIFATAPRIAHRSRRRPRRPALAPTAESRPCRSTASSPR